MSNIYNRYFYKPFVVWNLEVTQYTNLIFLFCHYYYLNMPENFLKNIHTFVALSHFKFDPDANKPIKIYCSTFFTKENPNRSVQELQL